MNDSIIAAIDSHIAELQKARAILAGTTDILAVVTKSKRGRPKGSKNTPKAVPVKAKRVMSEAGRAAISAAMKKRHAAKKRATKKAASEAAQEAA